MSNSSSSDDSDLFEKDSQDNEEAVFQQLIKTNKLQEENKKILDKEAQMVIEKPKTKKINTKDDGKIIL